MQNNRDGALALLLGACLALQAAQVRAETTGQSLTRIEAETMILKARERQLEVQASIVGKQNEIAAKQTMTTALAQVEVVGDPVIRAIEGIGGRMYATLQLNDGSMVDVQQGDMLAGGLTIVSIGPRQVLARVGKRSIRLASMASGPGANPAFAGMGAGMAATPRGTAR